MVRFGIWMLREIYIAGGDAKREASKRFVAVPKRCRHSVSRKAGVTIAGFPSEEEYLDRYFSDGSLELASAYATGDVQQRLLEGKLECRVLPEGWDYSV